MEKHFAHFFPWTLLVYKLRGNLNNKIDPYDIVKGQLSQNYSSLSESETFLLSIWLKVCGFISKWETLHSL